MNYNGTLGEAWNTPRKEDVLAPATCCKGVGGSFENPDFENKEFQTCYLNGQNLTEYNQEVSHLFRNDSISMCVYLC
jgi:hypothetical protein